MNAARMPIDLQFAAKQSASFASALLKPTIAS